MNRIRSASRPLQRLLVRQPRGRVASRASSLRFATTEASATQKTAAAAASVEADVAGKKSEEFKDASASSAADSAAAAASGASTPEASADEPEAADATATAASTDVDNEEAAAKDADNELEKSDEPVEAAPAEPEERITGEKTKESFQAETSELLNIVAHSLYTDKEVFLRELISNCSDALEKVRYLQSTNQESPQDEAEPLNISITTDEANRTITIRDNGVGMSRDELVKNLGTIARSGSKAFLKNMKNTGEASSNIIGRFGVGFYASFMVAERVEVFSRCVGEEKGHYWCSNGTGQFEIAEADVPHRGTKLVLHLKEDCAKFAKQNEVERISKKHSNYLGFPLSVNGSTVESLGALWLQSKDSITDEQHTAFFKQISSSYEPPRCYFQFKTDVPIAINSLFYIPQRHAEKFGMGREDPGVHLYSRKVLIQAKNKHILPDWLRFVKGVVDSEDIPLNISRESMQDSALIRRINHVLAKRLIRFLKDQSQEQPEKYTEFFNEFGNFIKEGICSDQTNKTAIASLLRFESSVGNPGELVSLSEYISRMPPHQKNIYYMSIPSRELAMSSPYFESFKNKGTEVLFMYREVDELTMQNLESFEKRKFKSVQDGNIDPNDIGEKEKSSPSQEDTAESEKLERDLPEYFHICLGDRVRSVVATKRIVSSPALVVDSESPMVRKMMRMVDGGQAHSKIGQQKLELNVKHPVLRGLNSLRHTNPSLAESIVNQVFDNALVSAGILDDPRVMIGRVDSLLEQLVNRSVGSDATPDAITSGADDAVEATPDANIDANGEFKSNLDDDQEEVADKRVDENGEFKATPTEEEVTDKRVDENGEFKATPTEGAEASGAETEADPMEGPQVGPEDFPNGPNPFGDRVSPGGTDAFKDDATIYAEYLEEQRLKEQAEGAKFDPDNAADMEKLRSKVGLTDPDDAEMNSVVDKAADAAEAKLAAKKE